MGKDYAETSEYLSKTKTKKHKKLDGGASLVADPFNANSTPDTDTHLLSDMGDTLSTSAIWLYRHSTTDTDTHLLGDTLSISAVW